MTHTTVPLGRGLNRSTNLNAFSHGAPYNQYQHHSQFYPSAIQDTTDENSDPSLNGLSHSLAGMMLRGVEYPKANNATIAGNAMNLNGIIPPHTNSSVLYSLPNGTLVCSDVNSSQSAYPHYYGGYGMNHAHAGHYQPVPCPGLPISGYSNGPVTPRGNPWMVTQQIPQEMPELAAPRRGSLSSNDGDSPQTPEFNPFIAGYQAPLLIPNHSPNAWGPCTPPSSHHTSPVQIAKNAKGEPLLINFEAWTTASPAIPIAIPAIDSPGGGRGCLEQIMHNPMGTTNVYVRGLHPNTSDEMLHAYGKRFGDVVSAKSIIEAATGACKGFGFIRYHNYNDAENCIRGFYYRGYEAKYARVGHNERLKTLASPDNTNLYVSNLPKNMNEADLQAIFKSVHPEFNIINHKVLKDENGLSRGVGFARFETPEICEIIIREFSGMAVGDGTLKLQIRYADTDEQKVFKAKTAKSRQFKSTEYNRGIALFQSSLLGYQSPTAASFASPLQNHFGGTNAMWMSPSPISPIAPSYAAYEHPTPNRQAQSGTTVGGSNTLVDAVPLHARSSARVKIENPVAATTVKSSSSALVNSPADSEAEEGAPISKIDFAMPCSVEANSSPTRSKL